MSAAHSTPKLVKLCPLTELEDGGVRRFVIERQAIAVVRFGDTLYAVGDRCTHQDISLSEGEVNRDTLELECWKHGSCFSLVTGAPNSLPATRPVPVYDVQVTDGDVFVAIP